jgi:hypothetical protein
MLFMVVAASITALPVLAADARQPGLARARAGAAGKAAPGEMDVLGQLAPPASLTGNRAILNWPRNQVLRG